MRSWPPSASFFNRTYSPPTIFSTARLYYADFPWSKSLQRAENRIGIPTLVQLINNILQSSRLSFLCAELFAKMAHFLHTLFLESVWRNYDHHKNLFIFCTSVDLPSAPADVSDSALSKLRCAIFARDQRRVVGPPVPSIQNCKLKTYIRSLHSFESLQPTFSICSIRPP